MYIIEMDNIYQEGSFTSAKNDPSRKLVIKRYFKRIYYCYAAGDPTEKLLVFFERELNAPASIA
jgi:hypothetical protein